MRIICCMNYISKKYHDWHVVWLAAVNRYIIFKPLAFDVFEKLANNSNIEEIAEWFSGKHDYDKTEAITFVHEINQRLQNLLETDFEQYDSRKFENLHENRDASLSPFQICNYEIFNKNFHFSYADKRMMDLIHPSIAHLQIESSDNNTNQFQLYYRKNAFVLKIIQQKEICWPIKSPEYFKGSVSMQLLNVIYEKTDDYWMGVFHASAVARNEGGVLISAPSGYGKSTLTALLIANGFKLLSDDFVPLSLQSKEIHSFPGAVSIKRDAGKTLIPYFPEIKDLETYSDSFTGKEVKYLSAPSSQKPEMTKVKAIIFPEYNPEINFEWKKVDNISVLNNLIEESWIAPSESAVNAFLNWYFEVPCYRLRYNNNLKAIDTIKSLFDE